MHLFTLVIPGSCHNNTLVIHSAIYNAQFIIATKRTCCVRVTYMWYNQRISNVLRCAVLE